MLNRKISILFIALLLGMLCVAIPAWAAVPSIGPQAPAAVNVGDQFTVDIVLNNATAVMGTQFNLQFNPSLLRADQVTDGNIFTSPFPVQNEINNTTGNINYASIALVPANAYTGSGGTAAVITFTALAAGTANLSFVPGSTLLGGEGGASISHTTTEDTITINGAVVPKPVITPVQPLNGATNVALNAPVQAISNMDVTVVNLAGVTIKDAGNNPVAGVSATLGVDNKTLTIAHNAFNYSTTYTVTIPAGAVINGGQTNDQTTWSFTTLAAPPPEKPVLTPVQPLNGATNVALNAPVQATSNMDVTVGNLDGVTIKDAGSNPVAGVNATLGGDSRTLTIAHNAFAYSTTYTVTIPAGAVINGGQTNDQTTWSFTTLAAPPPQQLNVTVNLTGAYISPDRPLMIDGSADRGGTPEAVNWSVVIKNSGGNTVATYTPESDSSFIQLYTPAIDLPVVADYTVQVTATPGVGDPVIVEGTFHIYNFPLKFSAPQITGSGSTRTVTAILTNLTNINYDSMVVGCQVTKTRPDGVIEVKSFTSKTENIAAGGVANISFDINAPTETGTYKVELFVLKQDPNATYSTFAEQVVADLVI
ncbi:MAG TPA: hypothetical protein DCK76_08960 [Desulfotomaculum sp.]|nr:MAG: Ig domain protein group 2 domain protein [Desulfotomaculum sp. 46_80]HAG11491.1 hypothetical protein [Desulfotomaculum sp.]HBY04702.1 hypothetical protein [Desulfotomaculum sp.]